MGQVGLSGAGIPEPGTLALLGSGAIALGYAGRRKRFGGGGGSARNDGMYDGTLGEQDLGYDERGGRRERPIMRK